MRWVAGFLLIVAAVLKTLELVTGPTTVLMHSQGRFFLPAEVGIEFGMGLLLLSGLYWRTLRWLVIALFATFAAYSLYLATNGAESCGCFGPLRVNPWWTFGLDSVVVLGLLVAVMLQRDFLEIRPMSLEGLLVSKVSIQRPVLAIVTSAIILSTALLVRIAQQRTTLANGLMSVGNFVVLEPSQWIGQKLPIATSVDLDLSSGDWRVLLHRSDCPVCQALVPQYERQAASGERIALVEVSSFGEIASPSAVREKACHYGRLENDHEWFVQTPVEIRLQDGVVTTVKTYDH